MGNWERINNINVEFEIQKTSVTFSLLDILKKKYIHLNNIIFTQEYNILIYMNTEKLYMFKTFTQ